MKIKTIYETNNKQEFELNLELNHQISDKSLRQILLDIEKEHLINIIVLLPFIMLVIPL